MGKEPSDKRFSVLVSKNDHLRQSVLPVKLPQLNLRNSKLGSGLNVNQSFDKQSGAYISQAQDQRASMITDLKGKRRVELTERYNTNPNQKKKKYSMNAPRLLKPHIMVDDSDSDRATNEQLRASQEHSIYYQRPTRSTAPSQQYQNNREINLDDMLDELRSQVRTGQQLNFRNFGLQNSALADVLKREFQERVIKKRDHMKDVILQRRVLSQMKNKKSKEANLYDMLNQSLSLDQQLINKGLPIFQLARLRVKNYLTDDLGLIGSPNNERAPKIEVKRDPGDLMFQTEIDPEMPEEEDPEVAEQRRMKELLQEYRARISDDTEFKPLIQQILKTSKKKDQFENQEDRIVHDYINKVGSFSKERRTGKKLPPFKILNLGAVNRMVNNDSSEKGKGSSSMMFD